MIAARGKEEMLCTRHEHTVDPSVATQERIAPFEKPLISGSPVESATVNDSVGLMVSPYVCTTISYAVKPFPVHDEHAGKDDHVRPENVSLLPRNVVNLRVHGSSDIQVDAAVKVPIADPNECLEEYKAGPLSKYGCMTERVL